MGRRAAAYGSRGTRGVYARAALPIAGLAPTITTQPQAVTVTEPSSVTFTVVVTGTAPLSYQWQRNGADVIGATSSSYTLSQTTTADTGAVFRVQVSNAVGSVTSNAVALTVLPPVAVGISKTFSSSEGYTSSNGLSGGLYPRHLRGEMLYESAYATKDGTLIEHADGAHGTVRLGTDLTQKLIGSGNRVGEFIPSINGGVTPGYINEVYPENREDHGVESYDNQIYLYFDRPDSLVLFRHGVYSRAVADTMATRTWTTPPQLQNVTDPYSPDQWTPSKGSTSNSGTSAWTHIQATGGSAERFPRASGNYPPPSGRPVVYSANSSGNAFMYTYGWFDGIEQQFGWYNVHSAYSSQFDTAVIIGGASASNQVESPSLSIIVPSGLISSTIVPPYSVLFTQMSKAACVVDGARWMLNGGRAGCKFYGHHVYWCGGGDQWQSGGLEETPYFFRADIRPVLANPTAALTSTFLPERLADAPVGFDQGALSVDYISNTMLAVTKRGIFLYDPTAGSWATYATKGAWANITSEFTEFASTFAANGGNYITNAHADFINYRGTTKLQKTYFFGGWTYGDNTNVIEKYRKIRSIKVDRGNDVRFLNVQAYNPENPAQTFGGQGIGPLRSTKHLMTNVANGKIHLFGGDWDDYYPGGNPIATSGYKPEGGGPPPTNMNSQNGRQEVWAADVADAVATGTAKFYMVGNAYAEYPWVTANNNGYYSSATHGPFMPDGLGTFTDRNGQIWLGPCDVDYPDLRTMEIAGQENTYAPFFKWNQPGTNNTAVTGAGINGVALGNGWTLPNQTRLAYCQPSGSSPVGTASVDYDVGFPSGSCVGWGRPNKGPAYDSTDHKARMISVQGYNSAGTYVVKVSLYTFDCTPDGNGKHILTRTDSPEIAVQKIGGPPQGTITGINTNWGAGGICNTLQIGRRLYATFAHSYSVTSGGNVNSTYLKRVVILSINVDNLSDITWVPLPKQMNWWLRPWDGPQAAAGDALSLALTTAQYRSMVPLGNKIVIGPEIWNKIGEDPWICVYDTTSQVWTTFNPPTNHDWPNTIFALTAVPSLGEVWLCGQPTLDFSSPEEAFINANGMHNVKALYENSGTYASRRIVRFKVN